MPTDEQLMSAFQGGLTDAFEQLFQRYRNPVYGFFRRRLTNPSRAEEMAQETFMAILKGVERYEPRARFRTCLFAIALNELMESPSTERVSR
jgi:RNA polymerase sigma-70 factor, ECF subfamily